MRVYLDYNATAPLRPEARDGDARGAGRHRQSLLRSTPKAAPRAALVEEARREVAALRRRLAGGRRSSTASGTEAANLALAPGVSPRGVAPLRRLIVGATEHPCVLGGHRFPAAEIAPRWRRTAGIDLDALARAAR